MCCFSKVYLKNLRTLKNKTYKHMIAVSKNVYIDKSNDIVNKYNNTYHITIKMKPVDVKDNTCLILIEKFMIKIINSKLVIM